MRHALAAIEPRTHRPGWSRASKLLGDLKSQRRLFDFEAGMN